MFCVSVLYPSQDGGKFDFEYYTAKHVPMVARYLGANAVKVEIRKGVTSLVESAPWFVCQANIWIESAEEFQAALGSHGDEILGDIPNFTNIQPSIQIDEVVA